MSSLAPQPLISFMLVTMNRPEDLRKCLASICSQQYANREVIVVDNGEGANQLGREFPEVKFIHTGSNTGAAGGKNIGFLASNGEFIVCLDDDETLVGEHVGEEVLKYFSNHPKVGVLSFNILDPQTGKTSPNTIPRRDKQLLFEDTQLGYFLGGGCAFRKDVVESVGIYWEVLNPYGAEEYDLALRVLDAGHDILWVKSIEIVHYESSVGRPTGRKVYALARNHPLVALRSLPWPQVISNYLLWWGYSLLLACRSLSFVSWFQGVCASMRESRNVIKSRKRVSQSTLNTLRRTSGPLWY